MRNSVFTFEFDIEHFDIHDEHIMDSLSFNKIIQISWLLDKTLGYILKHLRFWSKLQVLFMCSNKKLIKHIIYWYIQMYHPYFKLF